MTTGYDSLKVEAGFGSGALATVTSWTDITSYVQTIQTQRGRSRALDQFTTGTATVTLNNNTAVFDPDAPGSFDVVPMVPIRISANDSSSTRQYLFVGYVRPLDGWEQNYTPNVCTTTMSCIDFLGVLAAQIFPTTHTVTSYWTAPLNDFLGKFLRLHLIPNGTQDVPFATYPGSKTGTLVSQLLTDGTIFQPDEGWNISQTFVRVQGFLSSGNVLQWLQALVDNEGGALYVTRDGIVQFDGRYEQITNSRMTSPQSIFSDLTGAGKISFSTTGLQKTYANELYNNVTVTAQNQPPITLTDATSVTNYTQIDYTASGIQDSAAYARAQADFVLQQYKTPYASPSGLTLKPRRSDTVLDAALHAELRDRDVVEFKAPGWTAHLQKDVFVESVGHQISVSSKSWDCNLTFSSADRLTFADFTNFFMLDTNVLDDGSVLAY